MTQDLIVYERSDFMPALSVPQAIQRFNTVVEFVREVMHENVDFGIIPGTPKPTLLKPGAEKLTTLFGLTVRFEVVEQVQDWTGAAHGDEPFFYYWYRCLLSRGALLIAEADGSCNSRESKYRWRWVGEADVPPDLNKAKLMKRGGTISEFTFAVDKAETGGKYGKPIEYWQAFHTAIENGSARAIKKKIKSGEQRDAWEIDSTMYRIPNDDMASQVNTIQKMSQKRAMIAAVLIGCNASEFFTQDLDEVLAGDGASYVPPMAVADTRTGEIIEQKPAQPPANGKKRPPTREEITDRLQATFNEAIELGIAIEDTTVAGRTDAELIAAGQQLRAAIDQAKRKAAMQEETDLPL